MIIPSDGCYCGHCGTIKYDAEMIKKYATQSIDNIENDDDVKRFFPSIYDIIVCELSIAKYLSLMVYISDGYYNIKKDNMTKNQKKMKKYFEIITKLPFELQIYVSCITKGVHFKIINTKFIEKGLRKMII